MIDNKTPQNYHPSTPLPHSSHPQPQPHPPHTKFSNHTGYPNGFKGLVMDGSNLLSLMSGLTSNSLLTSSTTHLLTGYIGSVSFLNAVIDTYHKAKEKTGGKLKYVCDPVMGDEGKMYVSEELLDVYKTQGEEKGGKGGDGTGFR